MTDHRRHDNSGDAARSYRWLCHGQSANYSLSLFGGLFDQGFTKPGYPLETLVMTGESVSGCELVPRRVTQSHLALGILPRQHSHGQIKCSRGHLLLILLSVANLRDVIGHGGAPVLSEVGNSSISRQDASARYAFDNRQTLAPNVLPREQWPNPDIYRPHPDSR